MTTDNHLQSKCFAVNAWTIIFLEHFNHLSSKLL